MSRVALAYVSEMTTVTHSFSDSLQMLVLHDLAGSQHLFGGPGPLKMRCGTGGLPEARNKIAQKVVDSRDDEWLFWLDTDMGFEPDTLDRLLDIADPDERPIVGALCFAQRETEVDNYSGFVTRAGATILDWDKEVEGKHGFKSRPWYPPNSLVECSGTGSACILIHRSVLEKMLDEFGPKWYDRAQGDQGPVSEDLSFCMRARLIGAPVYVHTGIRTTHCKTQWVQENDFWEQLVAPPATERVAVLVPVMQRPDNAEPFMRSLRASTGLAEAYAIYSDSETRDAWKRAGANVIESENKQLGFAPKINTGYRHTSEPWLFLVGDDVRFRPGWWDHIMLAANATDLSVIGSNDLGNPQVMRGEHATHIAVRRSYVEDFGASWDGPDIVCHEGYHHNFVDNEIVAVARQRSEFVSALGARVEHLHPAWQKAYDDPVYRLGQSQFDKDARRFKKRVMENMAEMQKMTVFS